MNYHVWNYTLVEEGPNGFAKTVLTNLMLGYGGILLLFAIFAVLSLAFWYKTREIIGSIGLASIIVFVFSVGFLTLGWVNDTAVWACGIIAAILAFISVLIPKD